MTRTHHGFRVVGRQGAKRVEDTFAVRDAAIECAVLLDRAGLKEVRVDEVQKDEDGKHQFFECAWSDAIARKTNEHHRCPRRRAANAGLLS